MNYYWNTCLIANFLQKINQAFQSWNVTCYQLSHDPLRPTCHTICHICAQANLWKLGWVFLYRLFLSFHRSLSATMDPNLLREGTQHLLETADFIRNQTAAVMSTTQTTTTTTSSSTTAQPQPNSTTVRSEHNRLFGYRPPALSRAPRNPRANSWGTRCLPYTNADIAHVSSTWSSSFVCMATARQQTPPWTSDRIDLSLNGLGRKKLSFPKEGNMAEVHETILAAFPFLIKDLTVYLNRIFVKSKTSRNRNVKSQSSREIRNTTVLSEFSTFLKLSNLRSKIFWG